MTARVEDPGLLAHHIVLAETGDLGESRIDGQDHPFEIGDEDALGGAGKDAGGLPQFGLGPPLLGDVGDDQQQMRPVEDIDAGTLRSDEYLAAEGRDQSELTLAGFPGLQRPDGTVEQSTAAPGAEAAEVHLQQSFDRSPDDAAGRRIANDAMAVPPVDENSHRRIGNDLAVKGDQVGLLGPAAMDGPRQTNRKEEEQGGQADHDGGGLPPTGEHLLIGHPDHQVKRVRPDLPVEHRAGRRIHRRIGLGGLGLPARGDETLEFGGNDPLADHPALLRRRWEARHDVHLIVVEGNDAAGSEVQVGEQRLEMRHRNHHLDHPAE